MGVGGVLLGAEHHTSPGLHEHDRRGAPFLDAEGFDGAAKTFFEKPDGLVWGNETAVQALMWFEGALRAVLNEHDDESVVVVAHGTVIFLLVAQHNDVEPYDLWQRLGLPSFCVLSIPGFELLEACFEVKAEA